MRSLHDNRYKMPRMLLKIEGKGNGIKTNVVNLSDVSKALRVPTECKRQRKKERERSLISHACSFNLDPLKFMGFEFGSLIIYKEKGNDITTIINGAFKVSFCSAANCEPSFFPSGRVTAEVSGQVHREVRTVSEVQVPGVCVACAPRIGVWQVRFLR